MLHEPTDQELVIRLKSGDLTALAALDRRYRVRMVRLIAQLAKSYEEAEDIYQEAILKVVSHIDSFDHHRSFHNWLHRVAKNQCIDNYRRRKQVEVAGDDELLLKVAGGDRDPLDETTDRELQEEIQKAIDALPKRQRSVARLRLLEGLGYREIAERLGGSVQTVKSLFSVARKRLQLKLQLYLSCFAFPWRNSHQRLERSGGSASTATAISGLVSVAAHLAIVTAVFLGPMSGNDENDSITSQATNVVTITSSLDRRHPLPIGENRSREAATHPSLSSSRRQVHQEMPTLEHRTLKAVLPLQASTVLDSSSLSLASQETDLTLPESIPVAKPITSGETLVVPRLGVHPYQYSDSAAVNRPVPQGNSSNVVVPLGSHSDLPDKGFEQSRDVVREKRHPMQASLQSVSNSFRRLRAIRSVQELDAYSLAQLRRVARSIGQHPILISRCNPTYLRELLAEHWTPIVMLRSLVGGTHPWVIASWDTDTAQVNLTNPLEQHSKQLSETAFIEAWQGGNSPSTCLLLATRPLPDRSLIFPSSRKHVSTLTDNSPRIWH